MIDRIDQEMSYSQKALNLRTYRQEILASNIANADTPNFKARDVDFKASLDAAMGKTPAVGDLNLMRSNARHLGPGSAIGGGQGNTQGALMKYRGELQSSVDGNTVNMDVERSAFAENAIQMEALISFVNHQFKMLGTAMQP